MSNKDLSVLKTENFESEEKVYKFFEENLNLIFPGLTFVIHKYRPYQEGNEIDTIAWCISKKVFVLIEYKNKSKSEDPVTQILGYREALEIGDFYRLREILENKNNIFWKRNIKDEKKNLILICISPLNYFTSRQIAVAKANDIILIEFQKHESNITLINCHFKSHLELLEWKHNYVIINKMAEMQKPNNLIIDEEKFVSKIINDNELSNFLQTLEVDKKMSNWLSEMSTYLLNSSFLFKRKLFSEGEWKGGINFYLTTMRNMSVVDIKLEQKQIVIWLRETEKDTFIPPKEYNLEDGKWKNRWGKESYWKKYRIEDENSYKKAHSLLKNYLSYLEGLTLKS
ncbi:hypothetical protein [endosymbiont GvMRE of Glomus versiforme]|uniref:hypothetical protein n=1 Tax=endosymbiont GvMRE of Glomus versiforme TaxID=2039283 RepID=UPI000ED09B90|nr:hypothetical protein [endosymbiont GvMRE of Glomus versiforme]RHZ35218.1 hypothetical protein GvMRE_IIg47 [endosymbiont GvMRE of Glomus versiforme]